jgi:hypothetical protein
LHKEQLVLSFNPIVDNINWSQFSEEKKKTFTLLTSSSTNANRYSGGPIQNFSF